MSARRTPPLVVAAAVVLVAAAVLAAALLGGRTVAGTAVPISGPAAADLTAATARDDAVRAAGEGTRVLNTMRYTDFDTDYDAWQAVATGDLLGNLRDARESARSSVTSAKTVSTGRVLAAAAERLDARTGTATVLVAMSTRVEPPDTAPSERRSRYLVEVTRTPTGWLLSGIVVAPVE